MADDRAERRKKVYDHASSKNARGEGSESAETKPAKRAMADEKAEKTEAPAAGDMAGRQKGERDEMQRRHEVERRDMSNANRDEERTMNARHEGEYAAMGAKNG